jgi:hypothetical protein
VRAALGRVRSHHLEQAMVMRAVPCRSAAVVRPRDCLFAHFSAVWSDGFWAAPWESFAGSVDVAP